MHLCTLLLIPQVVSLQRCLFKEWIGIVFWMLLLIPAFQLALADDIPSVVTGPTPMLLENAEKTEDTALKKDIGFIDYTEIETRNAGESEDQAFVAVGDMLFEVDDYMSRFSSIQGRKGIKLKENHWPRENGEPMVIYTFTDQDENQIQLLRSAMSHWEEHTCIRFRPKTDEDLGYIEFVGGETCRSLISYSGGPQYIILNYRCYFIGTLIHEIGHAIGFLHEQARPDRDESLRIVEKNILEDRMINFIKQQDIFFSNYSVPYDYTSTMQYGSFVFSKNGGITLRTVDPKFQGLMGKNRMLTHRDKVTANKMYDCFEDWLLKCEMTEETCLNDGYTGPHCMCICAPGTEGDKCQNVVGNYYDNLLPNCSSIITQNQTTLKSPNYPNEKPGTWCVYQIEAPENHIIEVQFRDFQLYADGEEKESRCLPSFLVLMEDKAPDSNDTILCGQDKKNGDVFKTTTNELVMYFDTDGVDPSDKMRGFHLFISFLPHKAPPTTANNLKQLTTTVATLTSDNNTSGNDHFHKGAAKKSDTIVIIYFTLFWLIKAILV